MPELEKQVKWVVAQHRRDLETNNFVGVFMPETLGRRAKREAKELGWQWLFQAKILTLIQMRAAMGVFTVISNLFNRALRVAVR